MVVISIGYSKIQITWGRNKILEARGGGMNKHFLPRYLFLSVILETSFSLTDTRPESFNRSELISNTRYHKKSEKVEKKLLVVIDATCNFVFIDIISCV